MPIALILGAVGLSFTGAATKAAVTDLALASHRWPSMDRRLDVVATLVAWAAVEVIGWMPLVVYLLAR